MSAIQPSAEERARGFVRPFRQVYLHHRCGFASRMGQALAARYARGKTPHGEFCTHCCERFPLREFQWMDGEPLGAQQRGFFQGPECEVSRRIDPHHRAFTSWLASEIPPGTVVVDPALLAPRILRAVERLVLLGDVGG